MAANFVKGFVANFVKNSLHLEKPRPVSRKGSAVLNDGEEDDPTLSMILVPSTPRHCSASARLLRMVGLWRYASSHGKLILYGNTLVSWYHTASQLPWDRATHLIFAHHSNLSNDQLAHSLLEHIQAIYKTTTMQFEASCAVIRIARDAHQPLHLVVHFMRANFDGQLVRAVIDGGNSQTYVFAKKSEVLACIQASNPHTKNLTTKVPIPKGWKYDKTLDVFFKPSSARQAFMWPPTADGAKFWGLLALILLAAYLIGMYAIPAMPNICIKRGVKGVKGVR